MSPFADFVRFPKFPQSFSAWGDAELGFLRIAKTSVLLVVDPFKFNARDKRAQVTYLLETLMTRKRMKINHTTVSPVWPPVRSFLTTIEVLYVCMLPKLLNLIAQPSSQNLI